MATGTDDHVVLNLGRNWWT